MRTASLPLLDYGERLAREGQGIAMIAQELAKPGSNEAAYQAILTVARRQSEVHANDLSHVKLDHPNAWGSIWRRAVNAGAIQRTDKTRPCKDPKKHKHHSPVYRSLIVGNYRQLTERS